MQIRLFETYCSTFSDPLRCRDIEAIRSVVSEHATQTRRRVSHSSMARPCLFDVVWFSANFISRVLTGQRQIGIQVHNNLVT